MNKYKFILILVLLILQCQSRSRILSIKNVSSYCSSGRSVWWYGHRWNPAYIHITPPVISLLSTNSESIRSYHRCIRNSSSAHQHNHILRQYLYLQLSCLQPNNEVSQHSVFLLILNLLRFSLKKVDSSEGIRFLLTTGSFSIHRWIFDPNREQRAVHLLFFTIKVDFLLWSSNQIIPHPQFEVLQLLLTTLILSLVKRPAKGMTHDSFSIQ